MKGKNCAIEFGCSCATEGIGANFLAPLLQSLHGSFGGNAFLLTRLLAFLNAAFKFFQAHQFTMFPKHIALVFAQAGGTDATKLCHITGTPEIQYRVIASDKRTGDRQQFACDALERFFKWLPGRIGNYCCSSHIHATPARSSCKLAIFVRGEQAHLVPIKFAQATHDDGTGWHVDTKRQGIGCENRAEMSTCE